MEARKLLPPVELQAQSGRQDFDLHGDAKALFEKVAKSFGLDCLFDDDYQAGASFRFQMANSDYRDALHGLEAATGSFLVPLSKRVFLVVKDTPQKRTEREPTAAIELHLPEATNPQDFNAIVTAVQQAFAIEKVAFDTQNNSVILRDRVSKVIPARLMFEDLTFAARPGVHRSQVPRSQPQRRHHLRDRSGQYLFGGAAANRLSRSPTWRTA